MGKLSEERYQQAQRKIPGMKARHQIRSDLELAFRSKDLSHIRQVVYAAKRAPCLPKDEVAKAEQRLKECEAEAKARKAADIAEAVAAKAQEASDAKAAAAAEVAQTSLPVGPPPSLQKLMDSPMGVELIEVLQSDDREKARDVI